MDDRRRTALTGIAATRVAIGAVMALAPRLSLRLLGADRPGGPSVWVMRGFGVRDALLGAGALLADEGPDRRRWAAVAAAADAADFVTAAAGVRWLGRRNAAAVALTAASAAGTAAWALATD